MTVDAWLNKYQGQGLLVPGEPESERGQCVQAVDYALNEVYGLPYHYGNASEWWTNPGDLINHFDKVTGHPKYGDIVIWGASLPGSGGYGHIGLCTRDGDDGGFTSADSNWGGKTLHLVNHNYSYVLGYLRPKGNDVTVDQHLATKLWEAYFVREPENTGVLAPIIGKDINEVIDWFEKQAERASVTAKVHGDEGEASKKLQQIKQIIG